MLIIRWSLPAELDVSRSRTILVCSVRPVTASSCVLVSLSLSLSAVNTDTRQSSLRLRSSTCHVAYRSGGRAFGANAPWPIVTLILCAPVVVRAVGGVAAGGSARPTRPRSSARSVWPTGAARQPVALADTHPSDFYLSARRARAYIMAAGIYNINTM